MTEDIGQRLKEYRRRTNTSMPEIEAIVGITKTNLYKWEKGASPSNVQDFLRLKAFLDNAEVGILKTDFFVENNKTHWVRLPFDSSKPENLYHDNNASAGTVFVSESGPELVVDRILAPSLGNIEGLVEVCSDNMVPTINKGDRLGIVRLADLQSVRAGIIYYIVDDKSQCHVNRIFPAESDNDVLLVSDNKVHYPPITFNRAQIKCLCKVAVIIERC